MVRHGQRNTSIVQQNTQYAILTKNTKLSYVKDINRITTYGARQLAGRTYTPTSQRGEGGGRRLRRSFGGEKGEEGSVERQFPICGPRTTAGPRITLLVRGPLPGGP